MGLEEAPRPSTAKWIAKVSVDPDANGKFTPGGSLAATHRFHQVEVAWYDDPDRVKVTLKDGGSASVNQFYRGGGKDVILEIEARE